MEKWEVEFSRLFSTWTCEAARQGLKRPRVAALANLIHCCTDPCGVLDSELREAMTAVRKLRKILRKEAREGR